MQSPVRMPKLNLSLPVKPTSAAANKYVEANVNFAATNQYNYVRTRNCRISGTVYSFMRTHQLSNRGSDRQ